MLTAEENLKKPKLALHNFKLEIRRKFLTIRAAKVWNSPPIRGVPGKKKNKPLIGFKTRKLIKLRGIIKVCCLQ